MFACVLRAARALILKRVCSSASVLDKTRKKIFWDKNTEDQREYKKFITTRVYTILLFLVAKVLISTTLLLLLLLFLLSLFASGSLLLFSYYNYFFLAFVVVALAVVALIIVDGCLRLMPLFNAGLVAIVAATASSSLAESAL